MILEYQACISMHDACRFCKKHLPAAMYTWPLSVMPTQSSLTAYCKLKAYRYSMTHALDLFSGCCSQQTQRLSKHVGIILMPCTETLAGTAAEHYSSCPSCIIMIDQDCLFRHMLIRRMSKTVMYCRHSVSCLSTNRQSKCRCNQHRATPVSLLLVLKQL